MKTIVIAQNSEQVNWALRHNLSDIIPVTSDAQFAFLKRGKDPSFYLSLNPNKKLSQKYIDAGENFANNWYRNYEKHLQIDGASFGIFCRMHWLFLLPEIFRSQHVVKQIVKKYHPDEIVIFPKDEQLAIVNCNRPLESLVAKSLKPTLLKNIIVREEIQLKSKKNIRPISVSNLKRYFHYFIQSPLDILRINRSINRKQNITKADIVLHTQRHIIIDSLPFIKEIAERGLKILIVADSLLLMQRIFLKKNNVKYIDYDLIPNSYTNRTEILALQKFWKNLKYSEPYQNLLKDHDLLELKPLIDLQFQELFDKFILESSKALFIANKVLSQSKPRAMILAGNSGRRGLAFAFKAREKQILSFLFQHGLDIKPIQSSNIFDFMIVWGTYWKSWYSRQLRIPSKKIFSSGWFYVDNLKEHINKVFFDSLKIKDRPVILFVLADYMIDNYKLFFIVGEVIKEFSKLSKYKLIIRPHPGQSFPINLERHIKPDSGIKVEWDLGQNLDDQIVKSDLVIALGTTAGMRAMIWKKPVIHLKINDVIDVINLSSHGAAVVIKQIRELVPAIKSLLAGSNKLKNMLAGQKTFLLENCGEFDGNSSKRIVDFILNKLSS